MSRRCNNHKHNRYAGMSLLFTIPDNNVIAKSVVLSSDLNPGFENAVYITGEDKLLGKWETAYRLTYNNESKHWEFKLPKGIKAHEYKYLTGAFELGEKVETAKLKYEDGPNRRMDVNLQMEECAVRLGP